MTDSRLLERGSNSRRVGCLRTVPPAPSSAPSKPAHHPPKPSEAPAQRLRQLRKELENILTLLDRE